MSTTNNFECPICMDDIDLNKNCIATECGHRFHASCLMKSVAHNGFGCPYCRTVMAEEPEDEETIYSEITNEEGTFDDYSLRGFRFFFNNLNGEQHDAEDIKEENEDNEEGEDEEVVNNRPSVEEITQGLREKGITMECLVKCALLEHSEYDRHEVEFNRLADDIFDKICQIITDH
jgi:hypothetical protein